jgi:hypothetical protein
MKPVRLQLGELLAADDTTLAPAADNNQIALIAAAFAPDEELEPEDLTLASFTGSAPKLAAVGTQQVGIDPDTGDQVITIVPPAGGWRWECTAAPDPVENIYGFALLNEAGDTLLGVEAFSQSVAISEVGQEINLGTVKMTLVAQPIA